MRSPKDVIVGRIEGRINQEISGQKLKARQAAEAKVRSKLSAAQARVIQGQPAPAAGASGARNEKKKSMGWWPFGKKEGEAGGGPVCHACAKEVDPSWPMCPYCGTAAGAGPQGQAGPTPLPGGGGPDIPAPSSNRTMAIDLESLGAPKKPVRGWLVIVEGNQKGSDFRLYEGSNRIGAGADNDIVVTDEYLSTLHAQVRVDGNSYEFIDNGSTNGSYVNDRRVNKEEIIDNDRIRLGRTEFRVKTLLEY
jgi:hypothetical protein